jgi:hypothetical protein
MRLLRQTISLVSKNLFSLMVNDEWLMVNLLGCHAAFFCKNTEGSYFGLTINNSSFTIKYLPLDLNVARNLIAFAIVEDVEICAIWKGFAVPIATPIIFVAFRIQY